MFEGNSIQGYQSFQTKDGKDWRVGLSVKPKLASNLLNGVKGTILSTHESGFAGLDDPDGVILVCITYATHRSQQLLLHKILVERANDWITA